jgi:methionyl-tRNA formyltransferase
MKILIFGSSYLSASATQKIMSDERFEVVGHVPCHDEPTVPGNMPVSVVASETPADIKLSIQFDRILDHTGNVFNVHTGLLPEWGGTDILYHTLKQDAQEQGITFHKITEKLDYGPIVSRISYPVFPTDEMVGLYGRMAAILPDFVVASLTLLNEIGLDQVDKCFAREPIMFKRGQYDEADEQEYRATPGRLRKKFPADLSS